MDEILVPCLVASGAMNTLRPGWVAELAGIDCNAAPAKTLGVAGSATGARMVTTSLTDSRSSYSAQVPEPITVRGVHHCMHTLVTAACPSATT